MIAGPDGLHNNFMIPAALTQGGNGLKAQRENQRAQKERSVTRQESVCRSTLGDRVVPSGCAFGIGYECSNSRAKDLRLNERRSMIVPVRMVA